MKRPAAILLLLGVVFPLEAQTPDSRVGTLINNSDYEELSALLPTIRDSVSPPLRTLADALVYYYRGCPAESNQAIQRLVDFKKELGSNVLLGMSNLSIYNLWTLGDYAGIEATLRTIVEQIPETGSSLASMQRWMSALREWPPTIVHRPQNEIILPIDVRRVGRGEHLMVDAELNGRTEPFIFDTGCTHANFISTAAAERLGIRIVADSIIVSGMSEGAVRLGIADSMRIGPLVVCNPTFLVADHISAMQDDNLGEAVLGTDIIRALDEIRIEATRKRIVLPATPSAAPAHPNLYMNGAQYYLSCTIDGDPAKLHFDTGNVKTDLSARYYGTHRERIENKGEKYRSSQGGFGGVREFEAIMLPEISVAVPERHALLHDIEVSCDDLTAGGNEAADGSLGMDFITACTAVTIDLERMFVRIE